MFQDNLIYIKSTCSCSALRPLKKVTFRNCSDIILHTLNDIKRFKN